MLYRFRLILTLFPYLRHNIVVLFGFQLRRNRCHRTDQLHRLRVLRKNGNDQLVAFARDLTKTVEPQTCGNYFSHLSNIFIARPARGYPLSRQEFDDAVTVIKKLGLIRKGSERNRHPATVLPPIRAVITGTT